ncbi:hypothetical protein FHS29_003702 [Saccharothrix tamanrassetensis]|uniref:Uncharacterized protein n=1 Tax=Saccharothrix tamanrassetensis TaxID=1051531 RepID=A0A841CII4_9PSEU|nr:hypothetical protein [Saccharothrix tamanrassetensis]MBB5957109.1 hypothetical protein [Saccharothrix tamanrassetensis]
MKPALLAALTRSRSLSEAQLRGVVTAVASVQPSLLVELARRDDVEDGLRRHLLHEAPSYLVVDLLALWPAEPDLVRVATEAHGALPDLVAYCGSRGWPAAAVESAALLDWTDVRQAAELWTRQVSGRMPDAIRVALVEAALVERGATPEFSSLTEIEQHETIKRLGRERSARNDVAWSLMEGHPDLWVDLARDGGQATRIRRILLTRPEELTDEVLLACLPEVLTEELRGEEFAAGERLRTAARHAARWPRLRRLAPEAFERLVHEVVADGWAPVDDYLGPQWEEIAALAELSSDAPLLAQAVAAAANGPSDYRLQEPDELDKWFAWRAAAMEALTGNPLVSRSDLIAVVPALDERALEAVLRRADGDLRTVCVEHLTRIRQEAEERLPKYIEVPSDDELATLDDPEAELRAHLRHLKTRAAQRDTTVDGLLRCRFTTPEILGALPAYRVLESTEQAEQVACLVAEACGTSEERWRSLAEDLETPPTRTMTFAAWLERLRTT